MKTREALFYQLCFYLWKINQLFQQKIVKRNRQNVVNCKYINFLSKKIFNKSVDNNIYKALALLNEWNRAKTGL